MRSSSSLSPSVSPDPTSQHHRRSPPYHHHSPQQLSVSPPPPQRNVYFINPHLRNLSSNNAFNNNSNNNTEKIVYTDSDEDEKSGSRHRDFSSGGINSNSNKDDDNDDDSDGEVTEKFSFLQDNVKQHPRVKLAKKAMRLVKKMEKITHSKEFQDLIAEERIPLSDDDEDEEDEETAQREEEKRKEAQLQKEKERQLQLLHQQLNNNANNNSFISSQQRRSRGASIILNNKGPNNIYQQQQQRTRAASILHHHPTSNSNNNNDNNNNNGGTNDATSPSAPSNSSFNPTESRRRRRSTIIADSKNSIVDASLGMLSIDPNSTFSSDKLCREFLKTARIAGDIQEMTDTVIETVLEEVSPLWTNNDVWYQVQDSAEAAVELLNACEGELDTISSRFCNAADRVLRGAREEVKTIRDEVGGMQNDNDKIVGKIEAVKSEIRKEQQRADDLRIANSSRRLCLMENGMEFSKMFSPSVRESLEAQVGKQHIFGDDYNNTLDENDGKKDDAHDAFFNDDDESTHNKSTTSVNNNDKRKSVVGSNSSNKASADHQYFQSVKSRLRMLLSVAMMQVKGQKTADEQMMASNLNASGTGKYHTSYSHHSPVGSSRMLQSMESVLAYL